MKTNTFTPELFHKMDGYWRAANYLSVGQIYLYDNPLLTKEAAQARAHQTAPVRHWGTTAGLNFGRVDRPGGERPALPKLDTNALQLEGEAQWRTRLLNHEAGGERRKWPKPSAE